MSELLVNILEKYKARSGDEQDFMDKHTDEVEVTNAPGREGSSEGEKRKKHDRKKTRQGRDEGEDEEVYEEYLLSIIDEAIDELIDELDEEEKAALQEMVSDDQQYEDFVESVFADNDLELFLEEDEKEEDDDDDDSSDDDDDEEEDGKDAKINVNPKEKNKKDDVSEAKVDAKKVEAFIKKHLGAARYNKVKGDVRTMENKKGDLVISDRGHVLKTVPKGEWEDDFPLKEDVELEEAKDIETWRITYSYGAGKGGQRETTRIMSGLKPGTSEDDVKKIWDKKHPGKKFISAIKENVELEEGIADFSIAQLRKVVQALPGRAFRNMDYELMHIQLNRAADRLTMKDVETFLKDAQGVSRYIDKGQLKYYKTLLRKLKDYTSKDSVGKSPTFDYTGDEDRFAARKEAILLMRKIANYISKIKTQNESLEEGFSKWSVELPSFKKTIEVDKARSKAEAIKKAVVKAGGKPDDWKHTKIGKVEKLSEEVLEEGDSTFAWEKVNSVLQRKGYIPRNIANLSVKLKGKLNGGNVKWSDLNNAFIELGVSKQNIAKLLIALKR